MAAAEQGGAEVLSSSTSVSKLPRLHWTQLLAISLFWFALNFHWTALGVIILPSQVFKLVGKLHEGEALAFVLVPGAFVALLVNPLFGLLSDQMRGRFAKWGRRRPYILIGTLVNVAALVWMALAPNIVSLMVAYIFVQLSSNAAQAPFHALLPDIVPPEQRGMASGVMGLLTIGGNIGGVLLAGMFVDASLPSPAYQHGLWLIYGVIIGVMLVFMLVTILSVRERPVLPESSVEEHSVRPSWLTRSRLFTIGGTLLAIVLAWSLLALWNYLNFTSVHVSGDVQQVVLELLASVGLLRLFGFNPRRNPAFGWVFATRLVMMLGIYTIQAFFQYYVRDVVGSAHPEIDTRNFSIVVSLSSILSVFVVGWLSDRYGRKIMVYISGFVMGLVGLTFVITHSLIFILIAGALFGFSYGAYQSVDWALVADVLPSQQNYARDMGVWSISLALPQIIAPVLGGPLIDSFTHSGQTILGYQILFGMSVVYCLIGTITVRYIRGNSVR
ncbi:MFS transporter [Tengunoibacter tsumagoiensis]|uniref:MFS transporter n=1 Tax=Tengunoibacter tsumagoiensis TaxID=2014871 RepID=A0A401ZW44_9CHLR|nr:MFS transporter [Tengunoibacter tsumagoiensis]GCE11125.1 MFS transporter [Tengunoibacter tsumagoiensis]